MAEPSGQKGRAPEFCWGFHWFSSTAWEYPHESLVSSLMPLLPTHRNQQSFLPSKSHGAGFSLELAREKWGRGWFSCVLSSPIKSLLFLFLQNGWILAAGISSNYFNTLRKVLFFLIILRFVSNYWTTALNKVWWILSKYWQLNLSTAASGM